MTITEPMANADQTVTRNTPICQRQDCIGKWEQHASLTRCVRYTSFLQLLIRIEDDNLAAKYIREFITAVRWLKVDGACL